MRRTTQRKTDKSLNSVFRRQVSLFRATEGARKDPKRKVAGREGSNSMLIVSSLGCSDQIFSQEWSTWR